VSRASRKAYPACGNDSLPPAQDWSDWPNRYLNILRETSTHPRWPLVLEAEGADRVYSTALHNTTYSRDGDTQARFDVGRANWDVHLLGNNSFMYRSITLQEGAYTARLCYSTQTETNVTFSFDGEEGGVEEYRLLPGTGGEYTCTEFPENFSTDKYDITVTVGSDADVWIDSVKVEYLAPLPP